MKSYSVGAKRKSRKKVKDLYQEWEEDAAPVSIAIEEDPLKAPMQARANQLGEKPHKDILAPELETQAGKALHVAVRDTEERRKLFDTFMAYDKALNIYSLRVLSRPRFPAVSKMEFMPERLETRADDTGIDLRTTEEKAADARNNMRQWDGRLDQLHIWQKNIIRSVSYQQETLVRDGDVTTAGRSFIAALRALYLLTDH